MGEVEQLRVQVNQLQEQLEQRSSRRSLLRLAGAAAVSGGAAALVGAQTAGATTGAMQYGAANNAGTADTTLTSSSSKTLKSTNTGGGEALYAVTSGVGNAVFAELQTPSTLGSAVWGLVDGFVGYPFLAQGGAAHLYLQPSSGVTAASHETGEVISYTAASGSAIAACVGTGNPGTWRFMAHPLGAGVLFPIAPARAYDSRKASPGPQAILATGQNRTVSVANKYNINGGLVTANIVPVGATAVAYNLTVVNTVGSNGYLSVNPGGNTTVSASAINWSTPGLTTANASTVQLNDSRQITVICGGTATSCDFIVDVVGYYL